MKYLLVNDYDEVYAFTEKEYHEYIANLQDAGFDFEGVIWKQTDSVEKLCDEFVAVRKSDNTKHLGKIDYLWFIEQTGWVGKLEDYKSIYGAVWIEGPDGEPILKPIAKMNDEGELKLL